MKMKERFHAICRFLTMVSQGNHRVLFWLLGSAFAAATLPYLSLFFSARILNLLLAKSYRACLYTVVVFLLTQYGLGLFEKICRQYLDGQKELCLARTEQKITAKALELEFEKFEKTETMDAIRRTNVSSMGSGNVGDQLIVIHTLITSLLSVLYALFFLLRLFLLSDSSRNNFFTSSFSMLALLLLCGVQLALSSRINRKSTQKKIELNQGNDHSNSVANYLVNVMLEERRADDIRIGHLDHFLDVQFGKAMEHFLPMYLDFARFSAITDGKNALLSLLSNFAAYLVIGARALYGVLPIGDVLLYAGSVTRAMSDLQTFLATGSEFDYINSYLSTYEDFIAQPSMAYDGTLPIEKRDDGQYEFAFHDVSFSYPGTNIPVLDKIAGDFIQKIQTYNQEMQYYGLKPKTKLLSISEIDVFAEVMEKLKLTEKDKVICLERLRYADDKPIVYVKTFIPVKLCKGLIDEDLEQNSLYDTLKTKYNIEIAHINRQIHATVADPYLSDLLGIMENAPLLYITTVAYNQNDIPFEYSLASYRADMYKMNVDLYKDKYYK